MEPTIEYMTITPDIAREMLKHNTRNRKPSLKRVNELAALHGTPHWKQTADTIKFGTDGTLLDGQHRLLAITVSGVAQKYLVARNVDSSSQMVMDTGQRRNFNQHLQIMGVPNAKNVGAATQIIFTWENSTSRKLKGMSRVSIPLLWDFYQSNSERLNEAGKMANIFRQRFPMPGQIYSLLWWLFSSIDKEDAEFFFDRLTSSFDHTAGDPISQLHVQWEKDRAGSPNARGRSARGTNWQIGVAIKAWNLYRQGDSVQNLIFKQGGANPEKIPDPI